MKYFLPEEGDVRTGDGLPSQGLPEHPGVDGASTAMAVITLPTEGPLGTGNQ